MIAVVCSVALPLALPGSGTAGVVAPSAVPGAAVVPRVPVPDCSDARKGLAYYRSQRAAWDRKREASPPKNLERAKTCKRVRELVVEARKNARQARLRYEAWWAYHFDWRSWMPAKHQRVARCETGYQGGTGPGGSRFDWDSGTYVSAFGIYRPAYDDDAHRIGNLGWDETLRRLGRLPTPREQMQAVDSHRAAHGGWSGWGCRGA